MRWIQMDLLWIHYLIYIWNSKCFVVCYLRWHCHEYMNQGEHNTHFYINACISSPPNCFIFTLLSYRFVNPGFSNTLLSLYLDKDILWPKHLPCPYSVCTQIATIYHPHNKTSDIETTYWQWALIWQVPLTEIIA